MTSLQFRTFSHILSMENIPYRGCGRCTEDTIEEDPCIWTGWYCHNHLG